jgi:hypothetical protein
MASRVDGLFQESADSMIQDIAEAHYNAIGPGGNSRRFDSVSVFGSVIEIVGGMALVIGAAGTSVVINSDVRPGNPYV